MMQQITSAWRWFVTNVFTPTAHWYRAQNRLTQIIVGGMVGVLLIASIIYGATNSDANYMDNTTTNQQGVKHTTPSKMPQPTPTAISFPTATAFATATAIPKPTATPQVSHYPPKTKADLDALTTLGDMNAVHEFSSDSTGLAGVCPEPNVEVTVSPSLTGKRLAEDLLAYFYSQHLDSPCGSLLLAFHNQSEDNGTYTAGRINLDVTDSSGAANTDPNGTNLTYTLTLDVGDLLSGKEYIVTYQQ